MIEELKKREFEKSLLKNYNMYLHFCDENPVEFSNTLDKPISLMLAEGEEGSGIGKIQVSYDANKELITIDWFDLVTEEWKHCEEPQSLVDTIVELEYITFDDYYQWANSQIKLNQIEGDIKIWKRNGTR